MAKNSTARDIVVTGLVTKSYNPKRDADRFFYMVRDRNDEEWKGMAGLEFMTDIQLGAVIEVEGTHRSEWLKLTSVRQWAKPKYTVHEGAILDIGHVGEPRPTHYGLGCSTRLETHAEWAGRWVTIPCRSLLRHFENGDENGNGPNGNEHEDVAYQFPRRGRGVLAADVYENGTDLIVGRIHSWTPTIKLIVVSIPFKKVWWSETKIAFAIPPCRFYVSAEQLPFEMTEEVMRLLPSLDDHLQVEGTAVARSVGVNKIEWDVEEVKISVGDGLVTSIETLLQNDRVAKAVAEVKKEFRALLAEGLAIDLSRITEMFLAKGVNVTEGKAREVWASRDYDYRFMEAIQGLARERGEVRMWAAQVGFIILVGEWLVWEVPVTGRATYILPAIPSPILVDEDFTLDEWVGVLGRVLPDLPRKVHNLRYGEVGQALAACAEGIQFAFHVVDDRNQFPGWLEAVSAATESPPTPLGKLPSGLPSLADILMLAAGEGNDDGQE